MTPAKEHTPPTCDFNEAERIINDTLAAMKDEHHIEYVSNLEPKSSPPKWKKCLHKLLHLNH